MCSQGTLQNKHTDLIACEYDRTRSVRGAFMYYLDHMYTDN